MTAALRSLLAPLAVTAALLSAALPARADVFQDLLDKYIENEELPGGVLLISDPRQRRIVVSGVADRKADEAVTPEHRFYVASVGKMAVATATLQLVEEGRLSLDDKVAKLLPNLAGIDKLANARSAKLSHLLDHTSGIPDYLTDAFTKASRKDFKRRWTAEAALSYALSEDASHKPGKNYEYSNTNFVLLGEIIATADGAPLAEVLRRRVFERAGMTGTTVGASGDEPRLAHGYADLKGNGKLSDVSLLSWNMPLGDGPMVTTAADMERFLFALFRDGRLLKPATIERMATATDHEEGYGMGLELGEDKLGSWMGHTGSYDGFEAEIRYYPERQTAIVFMTNGDSSSDDSLPDQVAAALARGGKATGDKTSGGRSKPRG